MRVSVIQKSPNHVAADNLGQARDLVHRAVANDHPDLVVLPEMWSCLGGDRGSKWAASEPFPRSSAEPTHGGTAAGPLYSALRDLAQAERITLHGGSIAERVGDRLCNTTLVFGPQGHELARYRKIHLFDVVTPRGTNYRESEVFDAGNSIATFKVNDVVAGCAICYDLRFPELFARLRDAGAELLLLPAAFTSETGEAHWETLVRARAIETQCWIAAAATSGRHQDQSGAARWTFGHSMICDPWGTVVAQASAGTGWATASVSRRTTENVRRDMPVWQHRTSC